MTNIEHAIAGHRRLNRLTQHEVGLAAGVSRYFVSRVEVGARPDRDANLGRVAAAAGVPRLLVARFTGDDELVLAGYDAQAQAQVTP